MELEITWKRAIQVWWLYSRWTSIAIGIFVMVGALLSFVIAPILEAIDFPEFAIQLVTIPPLIVTGFAIAIVPMKMILGKNFGEFRLVLLATQAPTSPSA